MSGLLDAASSELPTWVVVFERIGPGSAILVFTGAVLWKLLPEVVRLIKAWRNQSTEAAKAIPVALQSLDRGIDTLGRLSDTMERGFESLNQHVYGTKAAASSPDR